MVGYEILIVIQMFVTGYRKIIFLVQTQNGFATDTINYDHAFIQPMIENAERNYKKIVIPETPADLRLAFFYGLKCCDDGE